MDQTAVLAALEPFLALAKSATSPRAASDLVTQATSAANTYVFSELLRHPNVQQLKGHEEHGGSYELLTVFAWGSWESYKESSKLPALNDAQIRKLKLLTLLTLAAKNPPPTSTTPTHLSYANLQTHLDLSDSLALEHLVTNAIYAGLLTATLNPAAQTVNVTSLAPLRDPAPGSVTTMISELEAWSSRCDSVLGDLEAEIARVRQAAVQRAAREARTEKAVKTALGEEGGKGSRGTARKTRDDDSGDYGDGDAMDVDGGGGTQGGGKKRAGGKLRGRG